MSVEFILFFIALALYLLSLVAFVSAFIFTKSKGTKAGVWLTLGAVLINGTSLVCRWITSGYPPLSGTYTTLSLFSFFMGLLLLFFIVKRWGKTEILGTGIISVILIAMLVAFINYSEAGSLPVALRSYWLFIHVPTAIFSYALFGVAAVCGALYLLKSKKQGEESSEEKARDLDVVDNMVYRSAAGGFILLTIAIVTGAVWAESAWGSYWSWDPKETWSLITWFVYAIFLHTRLVKGWRGRKAAIVAIIGFVAVIFTYFGVNLIGGLHSY